MNPMILPYVSIASQPHLIVHRFYLKDLKRLNSRLYFKWSGGLFGIPVAFTLLTPPLESVSRILDKINRRY
jgi:hypothetical protein